VAVLADEPDNRVLEAAAAGRADLIVTGDKAMQELGSFQGIPIVSAAQFVAQLQQQGHTESPGSSGQTS
jgi:predicted nucleic acid-binding protein